MTRDSPEMFTNGVPALTSPNAARQSSGAQFRNRPYAPNGTHLQSGGSHRRHIGTRVLGQVRPRCSAS